MKVNLIFDIGHIYFKSYSVIRNIRPDFSLTKENDRFIFVRKFFTDLCYGINMFEKQNIENIYFCFDSRSFRKQVSVKYKASRLPKEREFYDIMDEAVEILRSHGLNVYKIEGLEADDIVCLVASIKYTNQPINLNVIYSGDEDTHQLLNNNTAVYNNLSKKKIIYYTGKVDEIFKQEIIDGDTNLFKKFLLDKTFVFKKVNPTHVLVEKIFLGCEGDEVARLVPYGFGTKKIEKILIKGNLFDKTPELLNEEDLIYICDQCGIKYDFSTLEKQLQLVCLNKAYYPEDAVQIFLSQKNKKLPNIEFKMQTILGSTKYIHFV
jgi:hypothetical protein